MFLCKFIPFYIITVCHPPGAISCVVEAGSSAGSAAGHTASGRAGAGGGAGAGHDGTSGGLMEGRDGTGSIAEGRSGLLLTRGHAKAFLISSTKLRVTGHRLLPSVVEKNNTTEGKGGT